MKCTRRWLYASWTIIAVAATVVAAGSFYMLNFSLGYATRDRKASAAQRDRIRQECPWTATWMDSIYRNHCVRDTFVHMSTGYRAHAIYIFAPTATSKTAVVVHGYKMRAEGMLHIAYLYNHDLRYNVLLPDLYAHGQSEGNHIQMGWDDRLDVMRWSEVADEIFSKGLRHTHTQQVLHGISMGAATVMAMSGEQTSDYVKCFVEDCGYTSVWDEFAAQLKDQFGLPAFPLMYTTSGLCRLRYGWSFAEARQINQVGRSTKPMLFIHGDNDKFVPTRMVYSLYEAKRNGSKSLFIAKGSAHAMSYRDHHGEYTHKVETFANSVLNDP